ncbi:MAG: hypothetical protein AB1600_03290 [Bacteroidota bacterium]
MSEYRKNNFRKEVIDQHGITVGLPLFDAVNKRLSKRTQSRFDAAPKSIPTGNGAKRLQRIAHKINAAELNAKQQIVFDAFAELGPSTNKEVSVYLKQKYANPDAWDASTVNARNFELRQYGKLTADGKRRCKITGEVVTIWKVVDTGRAA